MMKRQDKELLLRDLSARLPYCVKVQITVTTGNTIDIILGGRRLDDWSWDSTPQNHLYEGIRPYLRPMSSMTLQEREEYDSYRKHICDEYNRYCFDTVESIDWLNAHHFDYRGLIPKGLALKAPEDMYSKCHLAK